MANKMTVSKYLERAVKRLNGGKGWTKHAYRKRDVNSLGEDVQLYCVLGSMGMSQSERYYTDNQKEAVDLLLQVAQEQYPNEHFYHPVNLISLNDGDSAKAEDIVKLVEKAYVRSLEPTFDDDEAE